MVTIKHFGFDVYLDGKRTGRIFASDTGVWNYYPNGGRRIGRGHPTLEACAKDVAGDQPIKHEYAMPNLRRG